MIHQLHSQRKKSFFLISLVAFSTLFLFSCKGSKTAQAGSDTLPQALLWKIEHKDIPEPSYLFGTIHMIPQEDFFLPVGFEDAFAKTDDVVFEIDLDDMSDMGSLMGLLTNLMMKDGMTLNKLLTAGEYQEVSNYFDGMGMPMFLLNKVKPMFLSMLAEVNMDPAEMESDDIISYEMEIYEKANAVSKEVGGLETMAYQMSLFDSIPYKEQAKMLLDAVRGTNMESDMFEETVDLYKLQDIEAMVAMVGESAEGDSSNFENILLHNRNHNWIPIMSKKMMKGPVFFAVGAGHLGGEEGVIRLLKKAGYQLSPVSAYKSVPTRKI